MDISNNTENENITTNYYTYDEYFKDYLERENITKEEFAEYDKDKRATILVKAQRLYKEEYHEQYEIELKIRTEKYEKERKRQEEEYKKLQEIRKEETIKMITRQTTYSIDEAREKLELHKGNYLLVIKEFMNDGKLDDIVKKDNKSKSTNQQIYGQIRAFMDYGNRKYEQRKELEQQQKK